MQPIYALSGLFVALIRGGGGWGHFNMSCLKSQESAKSKYTNCEKTSCERQKGMPHMWKKIIM